VIERALFVAVLLLATVGCTPSGLEPGRRIVTWTCEVPPETGDTGDWPEELAR